jgi:hypothetical protein
MKALVPVNGYSSPELDELCLLAGVILDHWCALVLLPKTDRASRARFPRSTAVSL